MEPDASTAPAPSDADRFGYFMLRTHSARLEGRLVVQTVLENLGTGEKRAFDSSEELGRFLDEWAGATDGDDRFRPPGGREMR